MTPQLVFDHEAGQATPAITLEGNRRTLEPGRPVVDFLLGLMDRCAGENRERNLVMHRRGIRLQKMYEGDMGDFHPTSGQWISRPAYAMGSRNAKTGKVSPFYPHNKIRRYFDANTAQALQSRVDLRAIATRDDDRSQLAASCARPIVDYNERQICDELFVQEYDKQKRCYGEVFFYCYWDTDSGPEVDELGVEMEDYLPGGSIYTCLNCSQSGDEQDFALGSCPSCGGQNLTADEFPPMQLPAIKPVGKKRAGDYGVEIVPKLQHDYDRFAPRYDKATWYARIRRLRIEELQQQFPWYRVPVANMDDSTRGVDYVETGTGNTGRDSTPFNRYNHAGRTTIRQQWFRPCLLDLIPEADVPLLSGDKIAKGYSLQEQYPHGAYVLFSGHSILDIWDDEHFDHRWVQLKHKHVPNRLDGDGGEDIVRPAQEYNELRSYLMSAWRFNVARPQVVRAPLKESDWQVGNPVVQVTGLPANVNLKDLHSVADPVPIDASAPSLLQQCDAEMQGAEAAFSTVTGDPDVQAQGGGKTMGGLQLIESNAQEMRLPELSLVALAMKQIHMNGLYFFRKCATEERWVPFKAEAGELAGDYLKGADLEGDIELTFGKGSYLPKDSARRRANLMFALEVGQGMVLNPQVPAKWRQLILDIAEVDISIDDYTEDVKNARQRIEQMKQLAPQAQQMAGMVAQVAQAIGGQSGIPVDGSGNGGQLSGGMGNQPTPGSTEMAQVNGTAAPYGMANDAQASEQSAGDMGGQQVSGNSGFPAGLGQSGQAGNSSAGSDFSNGVPSLPGMALGAGGTDAAQQQPFGSDGTGSANGGMPQGNGQQQQGSEHDGFGQSRPGMAEGNVQTQAMMPAPPSAAQILCQLVPTDFGVDDDAVHYAFVRNWLKGEECKKCDPVVAEAMHIRMQEHQQNGAMQAAQMQQLGMVANAPMMQMQQGQQQDAQTQQSQQADKQTNSQHQLKADDREHQLLLEDKRAAHQKEIAKMRTAKTKSVKR